LVLITNQINLTKARLRYMSNTMKKKEFDKKNYRLLQSNLRSRVSIHTSQKVLITRLNKWLYTNT